MRAWLAESCSLGLKEQNLLGRTFNRQDTECLHFLFSICSFFLSHPWSYSCLSLFKFFLMLSVDVCHWKKQIIVAWLDVALPPPLCFSSMWNSLQAFCFHTLCFCKPFFPLKCFFWIWNFFLKNRLTVFNFNLE